MADLEDEISANFVRKISLTRQQSITQRKDAVPLMLCDVVGADTANGDYFSVLNGEFKLRLCVLSGRIVGIECSNERCDTFFLDDGTACLKLGVFKDIKSFCQVGYFYQPEFIGPLRKVFESAETLFDFSNVIVGTTLLVLGRVSLFRGKICILGYNLFVHKGSNCDMEVAFKDYLILCYRKSGSLTRQTSQCFFSE